MAAACADPELEADLCTSTNGGVEGPAVDPEGPAPATIHAYICIHQTIEHELTFHRSIETLLRSAHGGQQQGTDNP